MNRTRQASSSHGTLGLRFLLACCLACCLACGATGDASHHQQDGDANNTTADAELQRAPGSERMARRLQALARQAIPSKHGFLNDRYAEQLLAEQPPPGVGRRAEHELRVARELLAAGRSEDAANRLLLLSELVANPEHQIRKEFQREVRSMLAIAHLRAAEQRNCLEGHNSESCLMPISEAGRHQHQQDTYRALELYQELLETDPEDLESRWLYNLTAMTLGRYPDQVPKAWLIPPESFTSEYPLHRFAETAHHHGLATVGQAGGVVMDDLDRDGDLDVLVSSWGLEDPLRLYVNEGQGQFRESSQEAGLAGLGGGLNLVHGDYDNDGQLDILVLRGAWLGNQGRHPDSLLRNLGVGPAGLPRFADVTEEAGLLAFHPGQVAAWADVDLDGWLDLFLGHESGGPERHPSRLMRNRGDGTFEEMSGAAGFSVDGFVKGAVWGDIDNDGLPDLYVSRLGEPNLLLRNLGGFRFEEVGEQAGVEQPLLSFPAWFFDYDNDGWLDLFVATYARSYGEARSVQVARRYLGLAAEDSTARLFRNLGDGRFEDVSSSLGVDRVGLTMGCNFGDLDNDGYLDFYLGTGAPDFRAQVPNRMFRNNGGQGFQDVTTAGGFGHLQKGHGVAFGDLDGDGDQDVLAVLGGAYTGDVYPDALFENPGHGRPWITLRLQGVQSNRAAIGARVKVRLRTAEGEREIHRHVSSGGSFGASSLDLEIGLGDALAIEAVEVRWPGGEEQQFQKLPMERQLILQQGVAEPLDWEAMP